MGKEALCQLLHEVTDIPLESIEDNKGLEELGIDSLMATEVLREINSKFLVALRMEDLFLCDKLAPLAAKIGISEELGRSTGDQKGDSHTTSLIYEADLNLDNFVRAFAECRGKFDALAKETGASGFWKDVYSRQTELAVGYIVAAFKKMGCDIDRFTAGDNMPKPSSYLPYHGKLARQFLNLLEKMELVIVDNEGNIVRGSKSVDSMSAASNLTRLVRDYPLHADAHQLMGAMGERLSGFLTGKDDAIQCIFGEQTNKRLLESVYGTWPLWRAATLMLGDFLTTASQGLSTHEPRKAVPTLRIIEVGGGTGGTAKHIVSLFRRHNVAFEYLFTDISASLVATARHRIFAHEANMDFAVLDIENEKVPRELEGRFDVVITSNCVHATPNLVVSLKNLRRLLRVKGVLAMVETTRSMCWLDMTFGLLKGWWACNDGRKHALVGETQWEQYILEAGFRSVDWSYGETAEAGAVKLIVGFHGGK